MGFLLGSAQDVRCIVCFCDQGKLGSVHQSGQYGHHSLVGLYPGLQCASLCLICFIIMWILQALGHRIPPDAHYTMEIVDATADNTD